MTNKIDTYEAARIVGLPYGTVTRWVREGLIAPEGYKNRQRSPILWGPKDLRELQVLSQLRKTLSLQSLREAVKFLREDLGHNPLSTGSFAVIEGTARKRRLVKICEEGEIVELLGKHKGQLLLLPIHLDSSIFPEDSDNLK